MAVLAVSLAVVARQTAAPEQDADAVLANAHNHRSHGLAPFGMDTCRPDTFRLMPCSGRDNPGSGMVCGHGRWKCFCRVVYSWASPLMSAPHLGHL